MSEPFAAESPGKSPQSLQSILLDLGRQIYDMGDLAQSAQDGVAGGLVLQSEVEGVQSAIDRIRGARDSLQILLRSMAYRAKMETIMQKVREELIAAMEKTLGEFPDIDAEALIDALREPVDQEK